MSINVSTVFIFLTTLTNTPNFMLPFELSEVLFDLSLTRTQEEKEKEKEKVKKKRCFLIFLIRPLSYLHSPLFTFPTSIKNEIQSPCLSTCYKCSSKLFFLLKWSFPLLMHLITYYLNNVSNMHLLTVVRKYPDILLSVIQTVFYIFLRNSQCYASALFILCKIPFN